MIPFNKPIPYTSSWKHTLVIGLLVSAFLCFVLIFLQPFDTYTSQTVFKELKLMGYSICVILPVILLHILEQVWFSQNDNKWNILNEVSALVLGFLLISILSFAYNMYIFNAEDFRIGRIGGWILYFGLPFAPIFLPFWAFLRYSFGASYLPPDSPKVSESFSIKGDNAKELLTFQWHNFIMAQSQSNYVDIYILENQVVSKHVLRSSLARIILQIPQARQIHRSFIVNPNHIIQLKGNTRKGWLEMKYLSEPIPVSPKYFPLLKKHLQIHPNTSI